MYISTMVFLSGCVFGSFFFLHHYLEQAQETTAKTKQKAEKAYPEQSDEDAGNAEPVRIRVGILGNHYETVYHQELMIASGGNLLVVYEMPGDQADNKKEETVRAGSGLLIQASDMKIGEICTVTPEAQNGTICLPNLIRAQKAPNYEGTLTLYREEAGILAVNELPLEDYLCSVVSSEMPSSYPEQALMAQAVCARTYAWNCMEKEKNSDNLKDLDDSVSFQVYNNHKSCDASEQAVRATAGEILALDEVLYYSTSCGTNGRKDLGEDSAFLAFLKQEPEAEAEYGSPWVRWNVTLPQERILEQVRDLYGFQGKKVEALETVLRSPDGQVQELRISGDGASVLITGEYEIRSVLAPKAETVHLRDGQEITDMSLLPSAWFCVSEEKNGSGIFLLSGGGYGHGCGMSQCGAAQMAQDGSRYKEILNYYYGESELLHVENF